MINIYTPREDTFFLLEEVSKIRPVNGIACEIGVGSGIITYELSKKADYVIGTDISIDALRYAKKRLKSIHNIELICCNAINCIRPNRIFQLIIFNPPYLPCTDDVVICGGENGVEKTIDFLIDSVIRLKRNGIIIFIQSSLSSINMLLDKIRELGLMIVQWKEKNIGMFERLYLFILKLVSNNDK